MCVIMSDILTVDVGQKYVLPMRANFKRIKIELKIRVEIHQAVLSQFSLLA